MLWKTSRLGDFRLEARDGAIGEFRDCLFEDTDWSVRWFVIDTGTWLPGRRVLFPPSAVGTGQAEDQVLTLAATRDQVRDSPPLDADAPVSRRYEERLVDYYGWPAYWLGMPYPAAGPAPELTPPPSDLPEVEVPGDQHLRSTRDLTGCYVNARDGDIGHLDDFLLDPEGWAIRYVVVDTRNWWPGKRVVLLPRALGPIDRGGRSANVELTRDQVRSGPEYDPDRTIDRAWEESYHRHHGYPVYW
jgi:hypothetical protein